MAEGNKVGSIFWEADLDNTKLKKGVKESADGVKGLANTITGSIGGLNQFAMALGVAFSAKVVIDFLGSARNSFIESQRVMAQTEAAVQSTGMAAGLTAQEIQKMAAEIQKTTPISDEAAQSGMNMLLTFTNIGKEVFPQASKALMDMATAMNSGVTPGADQLSSTAIQLGKALNDPINGITALSRVGVTFTYEQKKMIEQLVRSGQAAQAQKLILAELNREFGNSSGINDYGDKASQMANSFDDFKEVIGSAVAPAMDWFGSSLAGLMPLLNVITVLVKVLATALVALGGVVQAVGNVITIVIAALVGLFRGGVDGMKDTVGRVMPLIKEQVGNTIGTIKNIWGAGNDKMAESTKKSLKKQGEYMDDQTEKVKQNLADENREYERANTKRLKSFQQNLADMIWAHQDKVKDIKKDIGDENENYDEKMVERLKTFKETMADMVDSHAKKVGDIKKQIADETSDTKKANEELLADASDQKSEEKKGYDKKVADLQKQIDHEVALGKNGSKSKIKILRQQIIDETDAYNEKVAKIDAETTKEVKKNNDALQKKLNDLDTELNDENSSYESHKAKLEADEADTTAKMKAEHDKRLADYQKLLDDEMKVLNDHQAEVDGIKNKTRDDDITRLKNQYADEQRLADEDHTNKLQKIQTNASSEGDTFGSNFNAGLLSQKPALDTLKDDMGKLKGNGSNWFSSGVDLIKNFFNGMLRKLKDLAGSAIARTVKPMIDVASAIDIPFLASGTDNFKGGVAMVGELGPELVRMPAGSQVYSNADTKDIIDKAVQNIQIYIDKVSDYQDIQAIGRELAFRAGMQPA
jgi:hypothetical protein